MATRIQVTLQDDSPDESADLSLVADLDRFQSRARGRRLRDLALLGLWAESVGLRAVVEHALHAQGLPLALPVLDNALDVSDGDAAALSPEHAAGVDALMSMFD